jgi:hypothetical protein
MNSSQLPISLHCEYTLLRRDYPNSESAGAQRFNQTHASGREVQITLSYSSGTACARMDQVWIPEDVVAELRALGRFEGSRLSQAAHAAIEPPLQEIHHSVRDLMALVKYHLRHFDFLEGSLSEKSLQWSDDTGVIRDVPISISVSSNCFSSQPLNDKTRDSVQAALNSGALPLVAMRHLHRAKQERQPHHKWIDATIAAELAIKEVLCRAHPLMESMLLELPSPPFSKMYGPLLKQYLGEVSPFRKQLITGQEKRNMLIHRPGGPQIDHQEANDYVSAVEGAIFHLLSLLYPNDELIKQARHRTESDPVD